MTRKLLNLINNRSKDLEPNKKFLVDVMTSIERLDPSNRRKYQIHHSGVDKDKICKWFRIQGFKPNAFNLKENEICISVM